MNTIKLPLEVGREIASSLKALWEIERSVNPVMASRAQEIRTMIEHAVAEADADEARYYRKEQILEIAETQPWVRDGEVELDSPGEAVVSEGTDNGAYVSGWIWCPFSGTDLDRQCTECGEVVDDAESLELVEGEKLCPECRANPCTP